MTSPTTTGETPRTPEPIELWSKETVLKFFGGDKPLHLSTLYRGMELNRYPRPIMVAGNAARWVRSECEAAQRAMFAKRDEPKRKSRRGRHRLHRIASIDA